MCVYIYIYKINWMFSPFFTLLLLKWDNFSSDFLNACYVSLFFPSAGREFFQVFLDLVSCSINLRLKGLPPVNLIISILHHLMQHYLGKLHNTCVYSLISSPPFSLIYFDSSSQLLLSFRLNLSFRFLQDFASYFQINLFNINCCYY